MNAIEVLKRDHETVEGLFTKFEAAGPRAHKTKRDLVDRMIKELSIHAEIEEMVFYPAVREALPEDEHDIVLESLEEHHVVKLVLSELEHMPAEHERFDAKVTVLIENVRHHVEEEEQEMFPDVAKRLDADVLEDIGKALTEAKKYVPTRPHPSAPDEPPGNQLGGVVSGLLDRVRDAVTGR